MQPLSTEEVNALCHLAAVYGLADSLKVAKHQSIEVVSMKGGVARIHSNI